MLKKEKLDQISEKKSSYTSELSSISWQCYPSLTHLAGFSIDSGLPAIVMRYPLAQSAVSMIYPGAWLARTRILGRQLGVTSVAHHHLLNNLSQHRDRRWSSLWEISCWEVISWTRAGPHTFKDYKKFVLTQYGIRCPSEMDSWMLH